MTAPATIPRDVPSRARDPLFEITVPARADRLQVIRRTVEWAAGEAGFTVATAETLVLAVDEACQNVIRHAYGGDCDEPLRVRAGLTDDALVIRVIDTAPEIDPERVQPRALDDLRPGGLGTRLMREVLDEVAFEAAPARTGRGNVLKLVRRLERDGA